MLLKVYQSLTSLQQQLCAPPLLQVQDFIPRLQPSSPTPDHPQVLDLTLTPQPSTVQVQECISKPKPSTTSPDLPQVQVCYFKALENALYMP